MRLLLAAKSVEEVGEGGKIILRDHFAIDVCDEESELSDQRAWAITQFPSRHRTERGSAGSTSAKSDR